MLEGIVFLNPVPSSEGLRLRGKCVTLRTRPHGELYIYLRVYIAPKLGIDIWVGSYSSLYMKYLLHIYQLPL